MANQEDAIETLLGDYAFYRDWYRKFIRVAIVQVMIIGVLLVVGGFLYFTRSPEQKYYATRADGRVIELHPADRDVLIRATTPRPAANEETGGGGVE